MKRSATAAEIEAITRPNGTEMYALGMTVRPPFPGESFRAYYIAHGATDDGIDGVFRDIAAKVARMDDAEYRDYFRERITLLPPEAQR